MNSGCLHILGMFSKTIVVGEDTDHGGKISLHLLKDGEHIAAQAEGMKPHEDRI